MKRIWALFFILATTFSGVIPAECCCDFEDTLESPPKDCSFYIKVGSGISFSESAHVRASPLTWNPAIQGYNSNLGYRPIADLGMGCRWKNFADLEVAISARSTFKYRKFQTPVDGGSSYTREFDLDIVPVLFSINLLGQDVSFLNWEIACGKFILY